MFEVDKPVYIPDEKVKAVVKEIDLVENRFKCTYFKFDENGKEQRLTHWFNYEQLKPWRNTHKKNNQPLKINIKYFSDIQKVEKINIGDLVDLRIAEDVVMKAGEYKLIPLGVGMKLPDGYEANVVPRSSTFKNWGVLQTNSYGVIDNSYSGNEDQWRFPAYATRDVFIEKNSRICQFRIQRIQPKIEFVEVENLDAVSRGGLGSTGKA